MWTQEPVRYNSAKFSLFQAAVLLVASVSGEVCDMDPCQDRCAAKFLCVDKLPTQCSIFQNQGGNYVYGFCQRANPTADLPKQPYTCKCTWNQVPVDCDVVEAKCYDQFANTDCLVRVADCLVSSAVTGSSGIKLGVVAVMVMASMLVFL
jgi:hypothetical protein